MAAPTASRRRLDLELVARGLATSREQAQALIRSDRVRVASAVARGVDQRVLSDTAIEVVRAPRAASRGASKLAPALDHFQVAVAGRRCVDVGASTGGFTRVLLDRGASGVIAIDVGYGQLDARLRADPRVTVLDRTNIRYLTSLPHPANLATVDVSFISVRLVLEPLAAMLDPPREIVVLVKPQFEVGRGAVGKGGVVRDPMVARAAIDQVVAWCLEHRFRVTGPYPSPVRGQKGNQEYFLQVFKEAKGDLPGGAAGRACDN
jgi:23S rRNA (cytidine1920-2'-O)/16S rRNA (cytidine1409-2'-O)-methyltransferase